MKQKFSLKQISLFIIMGVLTVINWYDRYFLTAQRMKTFALSPLTIINVYVTRPFLWTCIGIFIMSLFVYRYIDVQKWANVFRVCKWIGICIMVIYYVCIGIVFLYGHYDIPHPLPAAFLQFILIHTQVFIFPGFLIGMYEKM